jgi:hypothetical protein
MDRRTRPPSSRRPIALRGALALPWLSCAAIVSALACVSAGPSTVAPGRDAASAQTAPPGQVASAGAASSEPLGSAPGSLTFGVIGDNGTGDRGQYEVAKEMYAAYERQAFALVVMVGDNIYGSERPQDFVRKFEEPYRPLLDRGVKFYASLGNHDSREQRYYKPFNMEGKLFYSFKAPQQDVRFFALDTTYLDQPQLDWLKKELDSSKEAWKIPYFHHPPYSSAGRHGSDPRIRATLEPIFVAHKVSVVFTGHDHVYERIKPQQGITYFVVGSGGKLRRRDLQRGSPLTARGFDTDHVFLVANIDGDRLTFQAITRTGQIVDSGVVERVR